MSCVLWIIGENFDPDAFETKSQLKFDKKTYKGTPRFKSRPDGEKIEHSALSVVVSEAGFDSPKDQINDTKNYLAANQEGLRYILDDSSIEKAVLDFGINFYPEKITQSIYLPQAIVSLAGALGIGIEISLYNNSRFE